MSKYQIAQVGLHEFRVVETRPGGFWRIVGRFRTRALAEAWIANQRLGHGADAEPSACRCAPMPRFMPARMKMDRET